MPFWRRDYGLKRALIGGKGVSKRRYLKSHSRAGARYFYSGHVGLPDKSCGCLTPFLRKSFFIPRYFHRRWLREWKRSIKSVLIREQDPWLGIEMCEKQSQKSSPRPFSKIMLNKLRLLPEISINYMSDIWVTIISYFLTTLTMNTQITETN